MNKFILKYKTIALITLVVFSLTSCLKDKGYENGQYGMGSISGGEFVSIGKAYTNPNALALESKTGNQTINLFEVTYDYVDAASENIDVTMVKDDAAVTAADATLNLIPASIISFPSPKVTIEKGKRVSNTFAISINTGTLNPLKVYGLAITISSVSKAGCVAPKNLKTIVYKISLKNKYDGVYTVTGPMVDLASSALTNWQPSWTAYLETTGPASVAVRDMTYTGGIYHPIMSGGAASYYGTFGMYVTFDPATDKAIDMVSPYEPGQVPGGATNTRTARLDPSGTNKWDAATRNIAIKYFMFQPNTIAVGPRVFFDETWKYVKARP